MDPKKSKKILNEFDKKHIEDAKIKRMKRKMRNRLILNKGLNK